MYHVHSNKRTQRSARLISKALQTLIHQKKFNQITISDIQKQTGIARTTFYRNFDNLIDVLEWRCDAEFAHLFRQLSQGSQFPDERKALQFYLTYWAHHSSILIDLISIHRINIIYQCQQKYAARMVDKYGPLNQLSPVDRKYFLSTRVGFVLGIILQWVRTGQQESAAQLQQTAERQIRYLMFSFDNQHEN